ncbi:MAG: hypothetical protein U0869_18770 [Chloroflexota bacterium]
MHPHSRRSFRSLVVSAFAVAAIAVSGGSALASHQVGQTGSPGTASIVDKAADPGAKCSYTDGGAAGGPYLTGIRQRNDIEITGTGASLQSVAVRPLVQHLVSGTWTTVKKGTLISGNASQSQTVQLTTGLTKVPVVNKPENPFRLALKVIWYNADVSVQGTRTIVVDSYVRLGGGVASYCKGRVIDIS